MANFYTDTPSLRHHLHHPLMRRIVELKERNFRDKDTYDYAPVDFDDAMDSYERVLEMVGEISADVIAPNAEGVDRDGPTVADGRVTYAPGTQENLDAVRRAGLMGMAMPRRYGGLNFPIVPYIMAADIVSRADAGFENLWGLQDCAETLYEFGNEDQHSRYIPRVCAGETMSMDLTEPDAGSDLQSVMLKATYDEASQCWRLNGVKRFITNGDSDIHLVLARSEEGTRDGRGLSMFIYDKRNGGVNVRRIENKMGIKGSPTCELVFNNAPAELCGERRLGLIKYVMALMNGARLGIMAQAVGLCEAAWREADKYADARGAQGAEALRQAGRRLHADGQGHVDGVCQPQHVRRHPGARRIGLHEGLHLRTPLPRRPHHEHLRGHHAAASRGRHPPRHHRHVPRPPARIRSRDVSPRAFRPARAAPGDDRHVRRARGPRHGA